VWRDFGSNVEPSAARRPWMPCLGNHEIEFNNGAQGYGGYLARYELPANGTRFPGRWYAFRVGGVLFVSLDANDVVHQDCGPLVNGPRPLVPALNAGHAPIAAGTALYVRGYSNGSQTRWLEQTLRAARADAGLDWIVVQMHEDAMSSSDPGNGSDKGIREAWLPLFDEYGVDLVLCGHDHDYERTFPVRGCHHDTGRDVETGEPVDTLQPKPLVTQDPADGVYDSPQGAIHLVLGGGGTSAPLGVYGRDAQSGTPLAKVFTKRNAPRPGAKPGTFVRAKADAVEAAIWSARRDTESAYGIAVFDVHYDETPGLTSITISYWHTVGAIPTGEYGLFEKIELRKKRKDAPRNSS
jgi:3',5'-cyclic AMP phosphodiesterase CpdA